MEKTYFDSLTKEEIINLLENEETHSKVYDYLEEINFPYGFQPYVKDVGCNFYILSVAKLKNGEVIPIFEEYWSIIDSKNNIRKYDSQNYKLNFFIKDIEFYDCTDVDYRQDLSDYEELDKFIQNHNERVYNEKLEALNIAFKNEIHYIKSLHIKGIYKEYISFDEDIKELKEDYELEKYELVNDFISVGGTIV